MASTKILRVCLSSELPDIVDRLDNYLYFAYDKLFLYSGKNRLSINFVISTELPLIDDQIEGMIYILSSDGSVHRKIDYVDNTVATIETPEMVDILRKINGTTFYINSDHRYMDHQSRSMTLPYNDGEYELNAAFRNDAVFNRNTILKFNEETNRFEIYGESTEEFIDFSKPFRGRNTDTVNLTVDGPRIIGNIRISSEDDNMIKVINDGLYIPADKYVLDGEFKEFSSGYSDFKRSLENSLNYLEEEVQELREILSPEALDVEFRAILRTVYPTIDTALNNYDQYVTNLQNMQQSVVEYTQNKMQSTSDAIMRDFNENSSWQLLDDSIPEEEVDYYGIAEEVLNPRS